MKLGSIVIVLNNFVVQSKKSENNLTLLLLKQVFDIFLT